MSRYVKADMIGCPCGYCEGYKECQEEVDSAPSIDIVFCKECLFSEAYQNDSSGVMGRFCEAFTQVRMVSDEDFCSRGERKESE
jgi:hypothetical protein